MKNLKISRDLQAKILSYLKYTEQALLTQTEMNSFFKMIPTSQRHIVSRVIFQRVLDLNILFKKDYSKKEFMMYNLQISMHIPEEYLCR